VERAPFRIGPRDAASAGRRLWFWDPSHFPQPVTPAAETFDLPAMQAGFIAAARELRRPLAGQYVRAVRGFVYFGVELPESAAALAAGEARYRETVTPLLDGALERWRSVHAPAAESLTAQLLETAARPWDDATFADALSHAVELRSAQWRLHDLALVPAMEAAARFTARYAERLGGPLAVQALLQGFPNQQTEAAEALDALAEAMRARPALASALTSGGPLRGNSMGSDGAWLDGRLKSFLDLYGRRAEGWDVGAPTWLEDPAPVLPLLRERLRRPAAEPGAPRRRAAAAREAAVGRALSSLPEREHDAFRASLAAAQAYPIVSEDHNALIDQQGMAALRAVILEAGRRLTERGLLRAAADAVWLARWELQSALSIGRDLRRLAAFRRSLRARRSRLLPPRTVGAELPAWAANNPTLADFFGLRTEPLAASAGLQGVGVSPGVAEGRARVVRSLDEADRLQPGDILVCHMTSPAWTPWLGLIAGAVVETGGMLSHTAILAREYGIPCVVNLRDAVECIPDGRRLRIDGSTGEVALLA
jgi:pyruvate,water dikinase